MLTNENYRSIENNKKYFSSSQFKDFLSCESEALAKINGDITEEKSTSLLIGSYVDAHFEGTLDIFIAKNPEITLKSGGLKSDYLHANYIIERIEKDPMMMKYLSGEIQVIKTGEIDGIPFKIKMDSYHPGKAIVDLKIMKDMEKIWQDGLKISFVEAWKYDMQAAIYQEVEGNKLPFLIACATKQKPEPDIELLSIPQERLDYCLELVKANIKHFNDVKNGLEEPTRCGKCNYCRSTKVLTSVIDYNELDEFEQ